MKYRRKPVIVEAVRWDGTEASLRLIELLASNRFDVVDPEGSWDDDPDATAACRSDLRGGAWVPMYNGDYVVVDDEGRLFPLRGAIFDDQFECWVGNEP